MKCGKPQKDGSQAAELDVRWETCEITWIVIEDATKGGISFKGFKPAQYSKIKWVANAIGPNGKYIAGKL
jgi:hypothetical protein